MLALCSIEASWSDTNSPGRHGVQRHKLEQGLLVFMGRRLEIEDDLLHAAVTTTGPA